MSKVESNSLWVSPHSDDPTFAEGVMEVLSEFSKIYVTNLSYGEYGGVDKKYQRVVGKGIREGNTWEAYKILEEKINAKIYVNYGIPLKKGDEEFIETLSELNEGEEIGIYIEKDKQGNNRVLIEDLVGWDRISKLPSEKRERILRGYVDNLKKHIDEVDPVFLVLTKEEGHTDHIVDHYITLCAWKELGEETGKKPNLIIHPVFSQGLESLIVSLYGEFQKLNLELNEEFFKHSYRNIFGILYTKEDLEFEKKLLQKHSQLLRRRQWDEINEKNKEVLFKERCPQNKIEEKKRQGFCGMQPVILVRGEGKKGSEWEEKINKAWDKFTSHEKVIELGEYGEYWYKNSIPLLATLKDITKK